MHSLSTSLSLHALHIPYMNSNTPIHPPSHQTPSHLCQKSTAHKWGSKRRSKISQTSAPTSKPPSPSHQPAERGKKGECIGDGTQTVTSPLPHHSNNKHTGSLPVPLLPQQLNKTPKHTREIPSPDTRTKKSSS